MRKSFHVQLAEAEHLCVEMAGLALEQLRKVMRAVSTRDEATCDEVVAGDDPVDEHYIELERRILTLLATQAPVASDLRLVSVLLHVNIALERVGDLCTNIAKVVKITSRFTPSEPMLTALRDMGEQAGRLIEAAMDSFIRRDLHLAQRIPEMDESISRLNRQLVEEVATLAGDETKLRWATRAILVSRWIERIGDHAVDIAEQVAFMITGDFHEFTDASHKDD